MMQSNWHWVLAAIITVSALLVVLGHHATDDLTGTHAPVMLHDFGGQFQRDYFISNWPQVEPPFLLFAMWSAYSLFGTFIGFELFLPLLLTVIWASSLFLLLDKLCERKVALLSTLMISLMGWGFNTSFNTRVLSPHAILWALSPLILYLVLEGFRDRRKEFLGSIVASIAVITHPLTAIGLFTIIFLLYVYELRWKGVMRFVLFCLPLLLMTLPFLMQWGAWEMTQSKLPLDSPIMLERVGTIYPQLVNFGILSGGLGHLSEWSLSGLVGFWQSINHEHLIIPYVLFLPLAVLGFKRKDMTLILISAGALASSLLFATGVRTFVELQVYRNLQFLLIPLAAWYWTAYFRLGRAAKAMAVLLAVFIVALSQNSSDTQAFADNLGLSRTGSWCGLVPQGSLVLSPPELAGLRMCGYQLVVTYKDGGVAYYSAELGTKWWEEYKEVNATYGTGNVTALVELGRRYDADYLLLRNRTVIPLRA